MGKSPWLSLIFLSLAYLAFCPTSYAMPPVEEFQPGQLGSQNTFTPIPYAVPAAWMGTMLTQVASVSEESHSPAEGGHKEDHGMPHQMMILVLQIAVIVIAARLGGEVFERYLHQPSVLGELIAGMIIGPFALGPHLSLFGSGPLFPMIEGAISVSPALYGVATLASIILLFMVGLETDFYQFMRFAGPGALVGIGGVVGSFLSGNLLYVWYSGESFLSPAAMFMGTVSTATSVGITARVLSEKKQLDSAEGTTILAGAVIDDVLGILILAVVGGIAATSTVSGQHVNWGSIGIIAVKAFGFWLIATAVGIALSKYIAKSLQWFKTEGSAVALAFGLACLVAGIAETFGLAMIIGAYIMGLSLSKENISHFLEEALSPIYACLVPVFFAVMGMLVNFEAMLAAFWFGLIYSVAAVLSKVIFSGLPCFLVGFNLLGASRIGIGMLPRGEVALIVAGIGASQGYIGPEMFGAVIMMTLITTVIAPPLLVKLFKDSRPGLRSQSAQVIPAEEKLIVLNYFTWPNHQFMISCLKETFSKRGFRFSIVDGPKNIYEFSGHIGDEEVTVILTDQEERLEFKTSPEKHQEVLTLVKEAYENAKSRIEELEIEEKQVNDQETKPMNDYDPAK